MTHAPDRGSTLPETTPLASRIPSWQRSLADGAENILCRKPGPEKATS